jgi:tRNA 2-thiouridine synthesizing protein A
MTPPSSSPVTPSSPVIMVDARGVRCPLPVIRLAAAARTAPTGTVITLLSTDPAAEPDVAAWCRMRGHELLDQSWLETSDDTARAGGPDGGRRALRSRIKILGALTTARSGSAAEPSAPPPPAAGTPLG